MYDLRYQIYDIYMRCRKDLEEFPILKEYSIFASLDSLAFFRFPVSMSFRFFFVLLFIAYKTIPLAIAL